jgi:predicted acetyltransferase
VDVIEALAEGPVATRELWRVLLDMDWKATLKGYLLPVDHPLLHQLRYPRRMQMRVGDGLWVRLVDVGAALAARTYGSEEPVVFDVRDAFLTENEGRWRLEGGRAERTDDEADLELDVGPPTWGASRSGSSRARGLCASCAREPLRGRTPSS